MRFPRNYSLKEVSKLIGVNKYVGADDYVVSGINEIHMVEAGDLTFVDHPKYYSKALNSAATTILINKEVDCPEGKALIISDTPFDDYMKLVKHFRPFEASTSSISPKAEIGEGTIIQPGAFIGNYVKIGKNCIIHANACIYDHCILGNDVIVHSGAIIGADAYYFQKRADGFKKFESCGRVILEDKVEVGALCAIDKGVSGDTIIGEDTKMDNHSQIGHDTQIGKRCLIGAHAAIAGVTKIEDDVIIWGRVAINKDIVIGKGAVILATSAIDKSVEGGKTYFGSPAIEAREKWKEMATLRRLARENR
ncbi:MULTISPECIES: UDP-3-O-(3-hydroxymyristoyl)glucosamine N-acyltransferase [unclassified Lentimicrobium]|uniref:UDP-3-O-(3-hydroxymyristoyl)glucosamine N-acyltransferase n=1 Tax=unclassified Lentimicrobium TaxID=2677434 RepID=UPI001555F92F|nr:MULTISPECIES: UDP-3-O-(3-hydroxymyristoyl)glucosamine N-acyltransferase [unclassified Lentimicrobium]NPD46488.1 UDP-3-O-(3-hydroxymyristoyl)glucosamine N-acyltransferase [Lentimicrobium sp. S6]NPD85994.1 UDP-3-O-(3-hydroxymyristoyl)glucosamine N-acyltransferase [Lentimicrobium sp. L6]